ncbi:MULTISPECIES: hypothetical protein [Bartonella]|uniref:Uncharacterized protein n=1 Tax=Bartonella choladocola TaxID=2750995 RepID=A0A1U9MIE0_9HYPH|nr:MULTISPECIES: hypothetical protein [Bartonella]AQT47665.1 hypothetical protein BBC0122_015620 [Bartonella choladocola]MBH9975834.1 hypothetical protein [Bartonella choladocola]MBI0015441.1 hypothetical protein [Bartonella sp. B10834G3]MBI0141008.1 hypothetical protein [Bartonella choladocola]
MRFAQTLFLLAFLPASAFSQETNIECKDLAGVGRSVMMVRQSGVPIEKTTSLILNGLKEKSPEDQKILDPVYKKIVELAYKENQFSTNSERIEITNKFARQIFERCARRLPKS